ncbi:cyclophilin-like fold protein [Thermodesulfobacteriota bacterium]
MPKIMITSGVISAAATLNETSTAQAIWEALPIETKINTWGDEIYFGIPVYEEEADDAREVVEMGDLGYWPQGNAFCIFFGPTPASSGDEIRAASAVNIVGKIDGDLAVFRNVPGGSTIKIEKS